MATDKRKRIYPTIKAETVDFLREVGVENGKSMKFAATDIINDILNSAVECLQTGKLDAFRKRIMTLKLPKEYATEKSYTEQQPAT
jgi:hypothetical protein